MIMGGATLYDITGCVKTSVKVKLNRLPGSFFKTTLQKPWH